MTIERALRGIAGGFVLLTLILAWTVNGIDLGRPSWLWFTAFVGLNLLQSAFTDWCPMIWILQKAGLHHAGTVTANRAA
jgi:hypothetical protein